MMWVAKYWKQIAIAALIAVLCVAWRIDRASQYREGKAAASGGNGCAAVGGSGCGGELGRGALKKFIY